MARSYKSFRKDIVRKLIDPAPLTAAGMGGGYGPGGLCRSQRPHTSKEFFFMGYTPGVTGINSNSVTAERNALACSTYARNVLGTEKALVVKRYNWSKGTYYERYKNDIDLRNKEYYTKNSQDNVYVCLDNGGAGGVSGGDRSLVEPAGKSSVPFETSDGYRWKYLYTIDGHYKDYLRSVNSVDYMPIKTISAADARSSGAGDTLRAQYNSERGYSGRLESATIDLSDTISFSTNSPTITVVGDGVGASIRLSVNNNNVNGISVVNEGRDYNYIRVKLTSIPTTHTVSQVVNLIQLNLSPTNNTEKRVPAESYFHIEKIMYNVRVDTADFDAARIRQTTFNFYGISKDYNLNKRFDMAAGSELVKDIKKNYRLSEEVQLTANNPSGAGSGSVTFDFSSGSPTFNVGDGITDTFDTDIEGMVVFFGIPAGETGTNKARLEVTRTTGTAGIFAESTRIRKGFGVTSGYSYYNTQSGYGTADIKRASGEVLYINYLGSNLNMTNQLVSNFVFLQEV
tara:strand:+ start:1087 stop:2625 length:1539 start_codon:yes stop_codon:yes gene_type:complete